ncbi:MAG: hypothetical protein HY722_17175 [Planctomycetes bacterium]|nr:hypothetical protein [Planctomycetota bacterium]
MFRRLLDWIAGKEETQVPAAKTRGERRLFRRVGIEGATVLLEGQGPYAVTDLSYGGLRASTGESSLPPEAVVEGVLQVGLTRFRVPLTVRNHGEGRTGFGFDHRAPGTTRAISDYLRPAIVGASLREVTAVPFLPPTPQTRVRWFQGDEGTQVFVLEDLAGRVLQSELHFLDYLVLWEEGPRRLRVGRLQRGTSRPGLGRVDPATVDYFQVPPFKALRAAHRILDACALPGEVRDPLLAGLGMELKRLQHRYLLRGREAVVALVPEARPGLSLRVVNLSLSGVAVLLDGLSPADLEWVRGEEVLEARLAVEGRAMAVRFRPAWFQAQVMGGPLEFAQEQEADRLAVYLAPRLLGQVLEEDTAPPPSLLGAMHGLRVHLYVGIHNTHVLAGVDPGGRLRKGRIAFMDQVVIHDAAGLRSYVNPHELVLPFEDDPPLHRMEVREQVDPMLKVMVRTLLCSTETMAEEPRRAWLEALG